MIFRAFKLFSLFIFLGVLSFLSFNVVDKSLRSKKTRGVDHVKRIVTHEQDIDIKRTLFVSGQNIECALLRGDFIFDNVSMFGNKSQIEEFSPIHHLETDTVCSKMFFNKNGQA